MSLVSSDPKSREPSREGPFQLEIQAFSRTFSSFIRDFYFPGCTSRRSCRGAKYTDSASAVSNPILHLPGPILGANFVTRRLFARTPVKGSGPGSATVE